MTRTWCAVAAVCVVSAGARGQGCPPGTLQYGPPSWEEDIEHLIVDHYGPVGPLVPTAAHYNRAAADVARIRDAIPDLAAESHMGSWSPDTILIQTSVPNGQKLTCTNTYFGAGMSHLLQDWWVVQFPRIVNIEAALSIYAGLPEVIGCEANRYVGISCVMFDRWQFEPTPIDVWRWTIFDRDPAGPTLCPLTRWDVDVTLQGTVHVLCQADCTGDGALTVADFGCFQSEFVTGHAYADCNADELLTVSDFGCFQSLFVAGCP